MEKNYYNNRPLLGGLVATAAIASVLSPASYNSSPANVESQYKSENYQITQALGQLATSWKIDYSCQKDEIFLNATSPVASHYEVQAYSPGNNTNAVVSEFDITNETALDMSIPWSEAEALGVVDGPDNSVAVIDTINGDTVMAGTIIDTVGCPRDISPTPNPSESTTPKPTITPEPIPTYTRPPLATQKVKMPKSKLKDDKKYRLKSKTNYGTTVVWSAYGRNKKNKKVCKLTPTVKNKRYLKTINPGKCNIKAFADLTPEANIMVQQSASRVVKR
jgi:hypothetical protein